MKPILIGIRIKNKSEILPLCLQALAFQSLKKFDIYIYDESDVPITDHYPVRLAMDLLQIHYKIDIHHQRRIESKNVAQALIKLLEYTKTKKYEYLLMLDSDMILTPNCLEILFKHIKNEEDIAYTEPCVIDINNALGHNDYSVEHYNEDDIKKFSQWGINHQYYDTYFTLERTTTTASIPLIQMSLLTYSKLAELMNDLEKLGKLPGEDIVMYYHLTKGKNKGLLISTALAYHYSHTESQRDWYNVSRQIQEKITKGEFL